MDFWNSLLDFCSEAEAVVGKVLERLFGVNQCKVTSNTPVDVNNGRLNSTRQRLYGHYSHDIKPKLI